MRRKHLGPDFDRDQPIASDGHIADQRGVGILFFLPSRKVHGAGKRRHHDELGEGDAGFERHLDGCVEGGRLVCPAGVVAIHLDFTACSQANTPVWAAYQDSSGPFTRVTIAGSTADFNISSSKAAVAIVYPSGSAFSTVVTYLTQAELLTFNTNGGFYSGCGSPKGKTITATVVGANDVYVSMGGGRAGPMFPGFPLQSTNVASGSQDAFAMTLTGTYTQLGTPKAIIRRDQSIPNGGSLAPFDFTSAEAFVPLTGTGSAGGGATVNANMQYVSVNNGVCVSNNLYQSLVSQSGNFPIYGF